MYNNCVIWNEIFISLGSTREREPIDIFDTHAYREMREKFQGIYLYPCRNWLGSQKTTGQATRMITTRLELHGHGLKLSSIGGIYSVRETFGHVFEAF